jgi:TonB family protein
MKIKSYHLLFRMMSFLSDKTNGFPLFAKYKLMLGTLIIGLSASSCTNKKTANTNGITCYDPIAVEDSTQIAVGDTIKGDTITSAVLTKKQAPVYTAVEPEVTCYEISEPVCYLLIAQEQPEQPEQEQVYTTVHQMPAFVGGDTAMFNFIRDNLTYPVISCYEGGIQGRVLVRFTVTSEGNVTNPEIVRSLDPVCDKEAIRVIELMPKWIPGQQDGKNVDVYYTLPITFSKE